MFNGIIFNKGKICKILKRNAGINLFIKSSIRLSKKDLGISISCDGVCLTLSSYKKNIIAVLNQVSKNKLNIMTLCIN